MGLLLVVSAAILAAIVYFVGYEETARAVREAGVSAFASVGALMAASFLLQATAWAVLNRPVGHHVSFATLFQAVVVGWGGNILTPSTYLGGEPLKVVYVGRARRLPYHEVAGTVLLSKYLEGISFIFFFSFSAIVAAVAYRKVLFGPYLAVGVTILVVAGMLLAFGALLWASLAQRWRPLTALVEGLARVRGVSRFLSRLRQRTRAMEDQVSRVFCEEGPAARKAFGALLACHVTIFLRPAAFFYLGAGVRLGLGELCLLFVAGQALLAFQLTPSGAGMLDGGLIGTFALMGFDDTESIAQCMAFLLCLRVWDIVVVGAGALLAARVGARFLTAPQGPMESPEVVEEAGSGRRSHDG
ncbi:MAG: lysylphosphatidylglycerol synthase transmembrane domain-containing protein [Candidatus Brocadiia bacterium]